MLVGPLLPQPVHRAGTAASRGTPRAAASERLDPAVRLRAEAERELNALRDLMEQQRKRDDEFLRRMIELI